MKKLAITLLCVLATAAAGAKDIKTLVVTTTPQMQCQNCENKIKNNLKFEKGIKKIETSVDEQRVTITYDADKNTPENIQKAFGKFGYKATEVKPGCCQKKEQATEGGCCQKKEGQAAGGCCKEKKQ